MGAIYFGTAWLGTFAFAGLGLIRHPGWALLGYYIVGFGRPNELDWALFEQQFSLVLVASLVVGSFLHWQRKGYPKDAGGLPMKVQIFMVVHMWIAGMVVRSEGRLYNAFGYDTKFDYYWKMTLVCFLGTRILRDIKWMHRTLWVIGFCGVFLGYWANHGYYINGWMRITGPGPPIGMYRGVYADRNDFAMMLGMTVIVAWYLSTITKSKLMKIGWLVSIPVLIHAVLLTESRGGLLGIAASMGYITLRSRQKSAMVLANVLGGIIAFTFFMNDELKARYNTIRSYDADTSALSRIASWQTGRNMAFQNPMTGVGLENYMGAFYDYTTWRPRYLALPDGNMRLIYDDDYEINSAHQAHNMWVQRAAEAGVFGFLVLVVFVVSVLITSFKMRMRIKRVRHSEHETALKVATVVEGLMIPYLVTAFFLSQEDFEYLYVIGMLSMCLMSWANRASQEASNADATGPPAALPQAAEPRAFPPPRRRIAS